MTSFNGKIGREEGVGMPAEVKPKQRWSLLEDKTFFEALAKHQGLRVMELSRRIAEHLPNRTPEQVRQRYYRAVRDNPALGRRLHERADRSRPPATTGLVASAVGPSPTGAPPPSAACSAGQQAAVAAQRGRPTMLQQVAAGRVCSAQQGTPQAGSCSQGVPVMPAQQPTQGSQPAAGGQQQGQGAAAGKLKVMFRPRDTSTKSAVEDCGENSRRQLRIGLEKRVRSLLGWLEHEAWPRATQRQSSRLHLFMPGASAAQSACWGPASDAALTVGDVHQACGCQQVLTLHYAWLDSAQAGAAAQQSSAAACSVRLPAPFTAASPAPTTAQVAPESGSPARQQPQQPRAPGMPWRLKGAAPLPAQGTSQQAEALPGLVPSQQGMQPPASAQGAAAAMQVAPAMAAAQREHQHAAMQEIGPGPVQQAHAAGAARAPLVEKPRMVEDGARLSAQGGAAGVAGAAEQALASGHLPRTSMQPVPGSSTQGLFGSSLRQATPAPAAGAPGAPAAKPKSSRMQGKSERRAGKGAAAGQPAVQLARAEPAAQQANSAAAQPKGALYGILYNGEGNGVGREVPGAGKRTCDAPKGAGAVGDAPKTNASGSRLSSRVLHELSLNVPDVPGAAAPQKATPQAGTKRRLGGEEEGTPPAGKKRRGCPDETLAAMANAMCAAQTIASLGQLPANLPANGLPNSLPAGLPSPGLQEPAPPPQAMDCAVPTAPLEPMDTGTGQTEELAADDDIMALCNSLLDDGAESWPAANAAAALDWATPCPVLLAALFGE